MYSRLLQFEKILALIITGVTQKIKYMKDFYQGINKEGKL